MKLRHFYYASQFSIDIRFTNVFENQVYYSVPHIEINQTSPTVLHFKEFSLDH